MNKFILDARLFNAVAACRSNEAHRYYLCGVFIEPMPDPETGRGVRMTCTDGHILATGFDPMGFAPREIIVKTDFKAKPLKSTRGEATRRIVFNEGEVLDGPTLAKVYHNQKATEPLNPDMNFDATMFERIDGTFPDYRRIIPEAHTLDQIDGGRTGFDTDLIVKINQSLKMADADTGICFHQKTPLDPCLVVPKDDLAQIAYVLMPMRVDVQKEPEWLRK